MEPNYTNYSIDDLNDVYQNIDREKYPERFKSLCEVISEKSKSTENVVIEHEKLLEDDFHAPVRNVDEEGNYIPNSISIGSRLFSIAFSLALLIYGTHGVYSNDLYIPGKRGGIHFSGSATWLVFASIICLSVSIILIVIDHYDKRDNENQYYEFGKRIRFLGISLFMAGIVLYLWQ